MIKECCNINNIVREFYNSLLAYTLTKIENKEIAEDIVQEVMYRFSIAYNKNEEIHHVRGWLYQVTRHLISDYYRKNFQKHEIREESTESDFENNEDFILIDGLIEQMIKQLPEKYSTPLLLSDIENIPQKEIARRLNLGESGAKMRVQRARKMLYEKMIECCDITYDKNGNFIHCDIKDTCNPLLKAEKELLSKYKD